MVCFGIFLCGLGYVYGCFRGKEFYDSSTGKVIAVVIG